jgi:hypothetical protein
MPGIVRGIAIALVVAGLFVTVHPLSTQSQTPTAAAKKAIPVPVCPPNDPNACHIDQW